MRKYIVLLFSLVLITGCKKDKYIECTIDINNHVENYSLVGTYKIKYNKDYVISIEKNDVYKSNNKEVKGYLSEYNNLYYYNLNDNYGGITYDIKNDNNSVIINASIDAKKLDITKMVKDNKLDQNYVKFNKITIGGIKKYYESKGAICK